MHKIEKEILQKLIANPYLRFSEIKSEELENNLFVYHLNKLIQDQIIVKDKSVYRLTNLGQRYSDKLSFKTFEPRVQPKVVTVIIAKNESGQYLLFQRKRQPFLQSIGFPMGKVHLGEIIAEAGRRELQEKTGLNGELELIGEARLIIYRNKDLASHLICYLFTARNLTGKNITNSATGSTFWGDPDLFDSDQLFPGFKQFLSLVKNRSKNLINEDIVIRL